MKTIHKLLCVISPVMLPALCAAAPLTVKAVNKLSLARADQTIELSAKDLAPLGETNLAKIHIKDAAGRELICQAVDTDYDAVHKPDVVIFQSDFAPGETKTFTVALGEKQAFLKEQFRAFGRFVRERFDDFAWENDRIAHRTYGKALESWAGEPLTSSTIDIWSKRTSRMVVNDWYLADNYHEDTGEGADFYSAGKSRGCGGNGLWAADQLWTSKNFVASRVLANGPIRVLFELEYEAFDVNSMKVSEVKRITLDAGSQFDRFQSFYKPEKPGALISGVGIRKVPGATKEFNATNGTLVVWEKMAKDAGMQGIAIIADPKAVEKEAGDALNHLMLVKCGADNSVAYWSGFAWDKVGRILDAAAWQKHVSEFAHGLASPIEVSVVAEKHPN